MVVRFRLFDGHHTTPYEQKMFYTPHVQAHA